MAIVVSIVDLKLISIGTLVALALFGGFIAFHPKLRQGYWMHIGEAFSVGVFLSVSMLHLLPQALHEWDEFFEDKRGFDTGSVFPAPFAFTILGYMTGVKIKVVQQAYDEAVENDPAKTRSSTPLTMRGAVYCILLFALSSPLGVAVGIVISNFQNGAVTGCITAFAAGTFLFIQMESLTEIIDNQTTHHIDVSVGEKKARAYLILGLLTVHGFFEGLALGVQTSWYETFVLFMAIATHKAIETFALGIYVSRSTTGLIDYGKLETVGKVTGNEFISEQEQTVIINDGHGGTGIDGHGGDKTHDTFEVSVKYSRDKQPSKIAKFAAIWLGIIILGAVAVLE